MKAKLILVLEVQSNNQVHYFTPEGEELLTPKIEKLETLLQEVISLMTPKTVIEQGLFEKIRKELGVDGFAREV